MKTIIATLALIGATSFANAQVDSLSTDTMKVDQSETVKVETASSDDTTYINLKNSRITIVKKSESEKEEDDDEKSGKNKNSYELSWWDSFDIGVAGIMNSDYRTELGPDYAYFEPDYARSRYIALNVGQLKGRIIKDYVGITTGIGAQIYNFKFDGETQFAFGDSLAGFDASDRNISKNKLRVTYLVVPVLLEFNTSLDPKKTFHISAGITGKVRIDNMYKQKFTIDGDRNKTTEKGDLGLNRWGADALVKVGYRKLTFFTQVGLLPLFEDNGKNPELYAFAAGLSLVF